MLDFAHDGKSWRIADLKSRWGTFVNGVKLEEGPDVPLSEGDLVRIVPWTFSFSSHPKKRGMSTSEDAGRTMVRSVQVDQARLADDMLSLLLESASGFTARRTNSSLDSCCWTPRVAGTGTKQRGDAQADRCDRRGGDHRVENDRHCQAQPRPPTFSRSLINMASTGVVAELSGPGATDNISQSIVQMNITAALCVPLMLGNTVAAYLYLDSRGARRADVAAERERVCGGAGRIASSGAGESEAHRHGAAAGVDRIGSESRGRRRRSGSCRSG